MKDLVKLYNRAYDEIRAKAQQMVGSQKAYRMLSTEAKRDLRNASKKLLLVSDVDNSLKQYLDNKTKYSTGYVYLITNKAWPDWIKVGRATNIKARLVTYQTSSPLRDFEVMTKAYCTNTQKTETLLLDAMQDVATAQKGEWVKLPKRTAKNLFNKVVGAR